MNSILLAYGLVTMMTITAPCSDAPLFQTEALGTNVGEATIAALDANAIPYLGTSGGLNSILGTPVGTDAIEVISDTEMKVYGWCYSVDGVQPAAMPDQTPLEGVSSIDWFYGSAHYLDGVWVSYCDVSSKKTPARFCGRSRN
ncbi:MAG: hypothetical protein V4692_13990 [Bdellovibrionota bacterium]